MEFFEVSIIRHKNHDFKVAVDKPPTQLSMYLDILFLSPSRTSTLSVRYQSIVIISISIATETSNLALIGEIQTPRNKAFIQL